ncbi:Krueppel-related zinc finger protein 1 [Oryzias latipes]|uniref:Krueppel-related zinc finger protein 1 n=1 Tax=Oryzias latipes TaxID=8090 RepID=UPI0005CC5B92|nr:Krueppel-related zinc finger protein 1 [Oryzias latipes]
MSLLQSLREFISERLACAAEEIFRHCEEIIVQYEQELCRQRRLLDHHVTRKSQLDAIVLPQHYASGNEDLCNHQRNSSVEQEEPEPPRMKEELKEPEFTQIKEEQEEPKPQEIKEEQEEPEFAQIEEKRGEREIQHIKEEQKGLSISQDEEQLDLKQETDTSMEFPTYEENEHSEADLISQWSFEATDKLVEEGNQHEESTSTTDGETDPQNRGQRKRRDICPANNLSVNMRTESDERPYVCEECRRSFGFWSQFRIHMRTHTGEKPFSCKECDKSFCEKFNLRRHMRTHTGEKPFSCRECDASFSQICSLKRHMRIHTGEKPFSCKVCDTSFSDASTLKRHIRTHTGEKPFSCKECDKSFTHISNLKTHMRTHTGERPFFCIECNKGFTEKSKLRKHRETHSKDLAQ